MPIVITFNLSDGKIELPGAVEPLPFHAKALDELDAQLFEQLGRRRILTPDDVRGRVRIRSTGAVLAGGWPTLAEARGKFLLVLDDLGRKRRLYLNGHEGLRGRAMFVNSRPGEPDAAVLIRNNPRRDEQRISDWVRKGYFVRTRAGRGDARGEGGRSRAI